MGELPNLNDVLEKAGLSSYTDAIHQQLGIVDTEDLVNIYLNTPELLIQCLRDETHIPLRDIQRFIQGVTPYASQKFDTPEIQERLRLIFDKKYYKALPDGWLRIMFGEYEGKKYVIMYYDKKAKKLHKFPVGLEEPSIEAPDERGGISVYSGASENLLPGFSMRL